MKNVHLLQTNTPTRIFRLGPNILFSTTSKVRVDIEGYHLYITNNDEVREGDWALQFNDVGTEPKIVFKVKYQIPPECVVKKIILTTDEYLITDGVQAIDDKFFAHFAKNPSCQEVHVSLNPHNTLNLLYMITIPEQPSQCHISDRTASIIKLADDLQREGGYSLLGLRLKLINEINSIIYTLAPDEEWISDDMSSKIQVLEDQLDLIDLVLEE